MYCNLLIANFISLSVDLFILFFTTSFLDVNFLLFNDVLSWNYVTKQLHAVITVELPYN